MITALIESGFLGIVTIALHAPKRRRRHVVAEGLFVNCRKQVAPRTRDNLGIKRMKHAVIGNPSRHNEATVVLGDLGQTATHITIGVVFGIKQAHHGIVPQHKRRAWHECRFVDKSWRPGQNKRGCGGKQASTLGNNAIL